VFSGAIISLMVAVGAAVLGFGGLPDATAATFAQHIFLIAIGLFVISALVAILDLELPHIGGLVMRSKLSETGFPKAVASRCDLSLFARFFHSSWPAQHRAGEDLPRRPDRDQVVERDLGRCPVEPIHGVTRRFVQNCTLRAPLLRTGRERPPVHTPVAFGDDFETGF
jgi:uncharacterized membrane protein YtjA (UPF0391 family)